MSLRPESAQTLGPSRVPDGPVRLFVLFYGRRVVAERYVVGSSGKTDGQCGVQHRLRLHL